MRKISKKKGKCKICGKEKKGSSGKACFKCRKKIPYVAAKPLIENEVIVEKGRTFNRKKILSEGND